MAIDIQSDGESLKTTVSVKSGRKKLYENLAVTSVNLGGSHWDLNF